MGKIKIVRVKLHRWGVNDYSHVSLYKKYGYNNNKREENDCMYFKDNLRR